MAHDMTPEEQDAIYNGMVEIAIRCDGAQSKDYKGFNGVDTHYGRRIAKAPRDQWTPEIFAECAHIILKYREQVLAYTGVDVGTLQAVKDAQDNGTNYAARDQARRFEQVDKYRAERRVDVVPHPVTRKPVLGIFYAKKDPDFSTFLPRCQALPGRKFDWDRKCNSVFVSDEAQAFIQEFDFTVSDAARALLETPRTAPQAPARPAEINVDPTAPGKVFIKTDKTASGPANSAVRDLPGRWFDRGRYGNQADATPAVVAFARTYDIVISPEAEALCGTAQAAQEAPMGGAMSQEDLNLMMGEVSRCGSPDDLPEVFVTMFARLVAGEE